MHCNGIYEQITLLNSRTQLLYNTDDIFCKLTVAIREDRKLTPAAVQWTTGDQYASVVKRHIAVTLTFDFKL